MQAEIITIGDEILIGQIVDTNSAWLGEKLNATMSTSVYFFMRLLSHNSMSCVLDLTGDFFSGCCFAAVLS